MELRNHISVNMVPFLIFFTEFLNVYCLLKEFPRLVEIMNCSNIISSDS